MIRFKRFICVFFLLIIQTLGAQDFSGSYSAFHDGRTIYLELSVTEKGLASGSMHSDDIRFSISGQLENQIITGTLDEPDQSVPVNIRQSAEGLVMIIDYAGIDQSGFESSGETLVFKRITDSQKPAPNRKAIVINDNPLTSEQIAELTKTYGITPLPGNYWYDKRSGLYGVVGYAAFGFMLPGHAFGSLSRGVSNGNTNVFVNGRELPQNEWAVWSQLLGYWIQPGNYWLDEKGNAGYVGNPTPTENLYAAAQRNAYRSSSGGDNFWSSRFGAGNYDSGNQRGYVSVPGHGPVGYGF